MNNKVSVIIPNYNRENLISRAISSVANQTYDNIEIIIIDDNSNDNSKKVIANIAENNTNIKYKFLDKNKGANYCRNLGVSLSSGDLVAFLDSDDIFAKEKIEKQLEVFNEKLVDIVFTNYSVNGKRSKKKDASRYVKLHEVMFRNTLGGFSTVMIKKEVFSSCGKLDESLPSCQDWDLYIKVLSGFSGYYLNESLVNYYMQTDSISRNPEKVLKGHESIFKKVSELNKIERLVTEEELIIEQNYLLGDLYRAFFNTNKAQKHYKNSLQNKFNFSVFFKLLSVSFGRDVYTYIKNFEKAITSKL